MRGKSGGMLSLLLSAGMLAPGITLMVPDHSMETSRDRRDRKKRTEERKRKKKARKQRKKTKG